MIVYIWEMQKYLSRQKEALATMLLPEFRIPVVVVWAQSFGGALHEPVVPFFYTGIGLSAVEIGAVGSIMTGGSLLLAPVYGWMLDYSEKCARLVLILACCVCGLGCILRALATSYRSIRCDCCYGHEHRWELWIPHCAPRPLLPRLPLWVATFIHSPFPSLTSQPSSLSQTGGSHTPFSIPMFRWRPARYMHYACNTA